MNDTWFASGVARRSRRRALRAGAGGLTALVAPGAGSAAQEATPAADGDELELLLVQAFGGGSLSPAADGGYTPTLEQVADRTIYFSDRPERLAGVVPTASVLASLAAGGEDPPNAALVARPARSADAAATDDSVWVVTLVAGELAAETGVLTYEVRLLDAAGSRFGVATAAAPTARYAFGAGHLFIDGEPGRGNPSFTIDDPNGKNLSWHTRDGKID